MRVCGEPDLQRDSNTTMKLEFDGVHWLIIGFYLLHGACDITYPQPRRKGTLVATSTSTEKAGQRWQMSLLPGPWRSLLFLVSLLMSLERSHSCNRGSFATRSRTRSLAALRSYLAEAKFAGSTKRGNPKNEVPTVVADKIKLTPFGNFEPGVRPGTPLLGSSPPSATAEFLRGRRGPSSRVGAGSRVPQAVV